MGRARRWSRWVVGVAVLAAVVLVKRRFHWVPVPYLIALAGLPVVAWQVRRWRSAPPLARPTIAAASVLGSIALLPVPWMTADVDRPPGNAWQLDGRLMIDGTAVDPPGDWYWLTVGRPPIVGEVVAGWISGSGKPTSMRDGRQARRPKVAEPAAAVVGLRRGGWSVATGVLVEVSGPFDALFPDRATLVAVNGLALTTKADYDKALSGLGEANTFTTASGTSYEFLGPAMPFRRVDVVEVPNDGLKVVLGGPLATTPAGRWFRDLAVGSSHGLVVALAAYVHASGNDLAAGRTIAATGQIRGDGSVGTIGGLLAKATAAREVGVDVLVFPARQAADLDGFDPRGMQLVPVSSLDEAIAALGR